MADARCGGPLPLLILPPQYFGSVYYYALMAAFPHVAVDSGLRHDKRYKSVHRCTIADTRGRLTLTVPVSRAAQGAVTRWSDMSVSSHGQWWSDHIVSLESAYGRTPFFEFYIDRFKPWLSDSGLPVPQMDEGIDRVMRKALGIATEVVYADCGACPDGALDLRRADFSELPALQHTLSGLLPKGLQDVPYWQIRADRLGFLPGLSILDLLFNMGAEAQVILKDMLC